MEEIGEIIEYEFKMFSWEHVNAAKHFALECERIEKNPESVGATYAVHTAYSTGCILSSWAFLEANINELFGLASNDASTSQKLGLEEKHIEILSTVWQDEPFQKTATLVRYQSALVLCGKKRFAEGRPPYQNVRLLRALRNALVHYKPEWVSTSLIPGKTQKDKTEQKMEKQLHDKFPLNPLAESWQPFFPNKCLGYGCAKWAVNSAIDFYREFYKKLEMDLPMIVDKIAEEEARSKGGDRK